MNLKAILISTGLVLVLGSLLALQTHRLKTVKAERDQVIDYHNSKDVLVQQLTTKLGQASVRSEVLDLTVRNLQKLQSDKDLQWLKQIEGINKRMNNVEQVVSTTAQVVGNFKIGLRDTTIFQQDTSKILNSFHALAFDNHNQWISLRGYIMPDTLLVTPRVTVPLQSVVYWEREKILGLKIGSKSWFKQTTSPNPYVTITEDKLIQVSKKPK